MVAPIGVSINCNTECNEWCPRQLMIICCCRPRKAKETEVKTDNIAHCSVINNDSTDIIHQNISVDTIANTTLEITMSMLTSRSSINPPSEDRTTDSS